VVRNKIKMFAQKKVTLPLGRHKIVILDEADSMTGGEQLQHVRGLCGGGVGAVVKVGGGGRQRKGQEGRGCGEGERVERKSVQQAPERHEEGGAVGVTGSWAALAQCWGLA
jgi:DNA polymerase III delta prime subunit